MLLFTRVRDHCCVLSDVTLDCFHLIYSAPAQLKTRVNRGNRDIKYDLCI